jgi:hypothetical protein
VIEDSSFYVIYPLVKVGKIKPIATNDLFNQAMPIYTISFQYFMCALAFNFYIQFTPHNLVHLLKPNLTIFSLVLVCLDFNLFPLSMFMDYFLHDKQIDCSIGSLQSCENYVLKT